MALDEDATGRITAFRENALDRPPQARQRRLSPYAGDAHVAGKQKTKVKVRRTGFFLVPDYASTAHMIQGLSIRESCLLAVVAPAGTFSTSCY